MQVEMYNGKEVIKTQMTNDHRGCVSYTYKGKVVGNIIGKTKTLKLIPETLVEFVSSSVYSNNHKGLRREI